MEAQLLAPAAAAPVDDATGACLAYLLMAAFTLGAGRLKLEPREGKSPEFPANMRGGAAAAEADWDFTADGDDFTGPLNHDGRLVLRCGAVLLLFAGALLFATTPVALLLVTETGTTRAGAGREANDRGAGVADAPHGFPAGLCCLATTGTAFLATAGFKFLATLDGTTGTATVAAAAAAASTDTAGVTSTFANSNPPPPDGASTTTTTTAGFFLTFFFLIRFPFFFFWLVTLEPTDAASSSGLTTGSGGCKNKKNKQHTLL